MVYQKRYVNCKNMDSFGMNYTKGYKLIETYLADFEVDDVVGGNKEQEMIISLLER